MKTKLSTITRLLGGARSRSIAAVLIVGVTGVTLLQIGHAATSATGSMSFVPSSGSATVGSTLVVALHENASTSVIGAEAYITYDTSLLSWVSDDAVAPFSVAPGDTASGGTLHLVHGAYSGQSGDQLVTDITFNVLKAGTATLGFSSQSNLSAATANTTINLTTTPGTYTLSAPSAPPVTTTTPPVTTSTPAPVSTAPASTKNTAGTSVKLSTSSSAPPVTVANGTTAQVSQPVSIQPATVQTENVSNVQYYLNGKLVATETTPPYTYHLDTTKLTNGNYLLTTKTNYADGTNKSSTQHILVTDGLKKSSLTYIWSIPILILILLGLAALIYMRYIRYGTGRFGQGGALATAGAGGGGGIIGGTAPLPPLQTPLATPPYEPQPPESPPPPSSVIKPNTDNPYDDQHIG